MAHVARVDPAIYGQTRHVLLPKDYCVMRLTGAIHGDAIAAVGLVGRDGRYVDELLELVPRSDELSSTRGFRARSRPRASRPAMRWDPGGGWRHGCVERNVGSGVVRDDDAMYQSGTSEILGIVSSSITPTPGVIVFPSYDGIVIHAAPTQAGGGAAMVLRRAGNHGERLAGWPATPRRPPLCRSSCRTCRASAHRSGTPVRAACLRG